MNAAALFVLLSSAPVVSGGLPAAWEPLVFPKIARHTSYEWDAGSAALHAVSVKSASGLVYRHAGPVSDAPVLRWKWKVSGPVAGGDARRKSGDDYAARLYITFKYDPAKAGLGTRLKYAAAKALRGEYPPHSAINYLWANALPKDAAVPNPYTDRVMMIAVRSGAAEAGQWREERRDVLADYRRLFGQDPPPYAGVAVMTDTDDTGGSAEAWYADISLSDR